MGVAMGDVIYCAQCRGHVRSRHACLPIFEVWNLDMGEDEGDAIEVRGESAYWAALRYAEDMDEGYTLIDAPETIVVRDPRTGIVKRFVISGEVTIDFHAREVET